MKKKLSSNQGSSRTAPILSPMEERVLGQAIRWADEYASAKETGDRLAYRKMPTTERFSKHFRYGHGEMLALLNRLEENDLLVKRRRKSAGLSGNGYDGSLYSEVVPTDWGREVSSRNE